MGSNYTVTDSLTYNRLPWLPGMPMSDSIGTGTPIIFGSDNSKNTSSQLVGDIYEFDKKAQKTERTTSDKIKQAEKEATGLNITNDQLKDVQEVNEQKTNEETAGPKAHEEIACYTAIGAVSSLGLHPIDNTRAYLFGEHNKLFSRATDIYNIQTEANLFEEATTTASYNKVYRKNARIMSDAKAAMRKAEILSRKANWNGPLSREVYDEMSAKMKKILKELAKDPKNKEAQQALKNLTAAINDTNSQRISWKGKQWRKFKNATWRKWRGKAALSLEQPTVETFRSASTVSTGTQAVASSTASTVAAGTQAATEASTAATQTAAQAMQGASKGAKILRGVKATGKFLGKLPWLVAAFEAFTDKDKISAAYKKDGETVGTNCSKQLGKTALKAGGAMAGMALGTKLGLAIGSVVPGVGNIVGGIIGAVAGFALGGLCSWLGREGGKLLGDKLIDEKDPGAVAIADSLKLKKDATKEERSEQIKIAADTVIWARENRDKLSRKQQQSIDILDKNLVNANIIEAKSV